jgi:hypothetical protein
MFMNLDTISVINIGSSVERDILDFDYKNCSNIPYKTRAKIVISPTQRTFYNAFHRGMCHTLRLYTSMERLKRLYTSPGSLLEIYYFR